MIRKTFQVVCIQKDAQTIKLEIFGMIEDHCICCDKNPHRFILTILTIILITSRTLEQTLIEKRFVRISVCIWWQFSRFFHHSTFDHGDASSIEKFVCTIWTTFDTLTIVVNKFSANFAIRSCWTFATSKTGWMATFTGWCTGGTVAVRAYYG